MGFSREKRSEDMMKKFVVGILFLLALVSFVSAQTETKNITVSMTVNKILSVTGVTDLALGSINPGSAATASGASTIRTNYYSWTVKAYALKGTLTQYASGAYVTTSGATTIPYTFTFNSAATVSTEKFVSQTLPTSVSSAPTATFTAKTSGGASGQTFAYAVNVTAADTTNADAASYQDVIYFIVAVN